MATFWVESAAKEQDGKVILWEVHPGHPDGECFIANDGIKAEVEETPAIKDLLAKGLIKKVSNWDKPAMPVQKPKTVVATDEDEDEVVARVEVAPAPAGGINRGGRPPRRGQ